MKSHEVVGYVYEGAAYCAECFLKSNNNAIDDDTDTAIFADSEFDSYPTCGDCGEAIEDVKLSPDGLVVKWWADLDKAVAFELLDLAMAWHGGQNTACYEFLSSRGSCSEKRILAACREMRFDIEAALEKGADAGFEANLEVVEGALDGTRFI